MQSPRVHGAIARAGTHLGLRMALARTLAWALLLGGWLVLGALGRLVLPGWAGGQWAAALWLAAIGALLAWWGQRPPAVRGLRWRLLAAAGTAALALAAVDRGAGALGVALLAVAWAGLLVAASLCVRALRHARPVRAAAPLWPALMGAALAWAAAGDALALRADAGLLTAALLLVAVLLVWLLPAHAALKRGCRSALFDCSLPLLAPWVWRDAAQWPLQAAALAMLPMMAMLPLMGEWCAGPGRTPAAVALLHLAAMVLPALALQAVLRRMGPRALRAAVVALLAAGSAVVAMQPGVQGLMSASLLHAAAWGLAWAGPMLARDAGAAASPTPLPGPAAAPLVQAGLAAAAVLALGAAADAMGPDALLAVHLALGGVAVAGLVPALRATARLPA
jgi:hypothetical protein